MTVLYRGENSYFLGASACVVDTSREMASNWASEHIFENDALKWVIARYAEADNPNSNGQAWSFEDLRMAQPTLNYGPMNMLHKPDHIVGAFVANEMIYPTGPADDAAGAANPYIETVGAFWKYYFPEELAAVERAYSEGSLFVSMECVAETVTFRDGEGDEATFDYAGPKHPSYGEWNDRGKERWLNNPHFLGGALIIPPVQPGWSGAEVKELSKFVSEHADLASETYDTIVSENPFLDGSTAEQVTLALMKSFQDEGNSIKNVGVPKTDISEGDGPSLISPLGGDMSEKTFTEAELNDAINSAVAPLQAELTELRAQSEASEVEARVEAVKAEFEAKLEGVQRELDEALIKADAAEKELADSISWIQAVVDADAEQAAFDARRAERVEKVRSVANLPDERVEASADRWAAMSDDDFDGLLAEYAEVAASVKKGSEAAGEGTDNAELGDTGFQPSETAAASGSVGDDRRALLALRSQGIDLKRV